MAPSELFVGRSLKDMARREDVVATKFQPLTEEETFQFVIRMITPLTAIYA